MKKFVCYGLLIIMFFSFSAAVDAKAQTLDQLLAEVKANRDAYEKAKSQKTLTEAERNQASADKSKVESEIDGIKTELKKIEEQTKKLQDDIAKKDKQMKEIMGFVQVSNGEANYLEYIFGATDFTDFIYRVSVAEQLGDYNEQLINEYNKDIKDLDQKQTELNAKNQELSKKQEELSILEAKLNKEIETIQEGMLSKDEEYRTTINTINSMKKMGCGGSETLASCQSRIISRVSAAGSSGGISVPNSNNTYMPIASGYVTSGYGPRSGEFHTGIDFASGHNDTVYPITDGTVINIDPPAYPGACGNNRVYVLHRINGAVYTTSYWHLTSVSVGVGQSVSVSTPIGTIGGRGYTDACAYGGHVHLNLFSGYHTTNSGRINPAIVLPQASYEHYFSHR